MIINNINKIKSFLFIGCFLLIQSCVAPPSAIDKDPIRDSLPVNELYIVNNMAESISLINLDRMDSSQNPFIVNDILLTEKVPNQLIFNLDYGYIVNSSDNSISIFDSRTMNNVGTVELSTGNNPWNIALVTKGLNLYGLVSNFLTDDISIIKFDLLKTSGSVIKTIELDPFPLKTDYRARPEGIAIINQKAYIGCTAWNFNKNNFDEGIVAVLDLSSSNPSNWSIITYLTSKTNPQTIIPYQSNNEVHAICTGINENDDGIIHIIDTTSDTTITNISIGGSPYRGAKNTNENITYLSGINKILAYNYSSKKMINSSTNPLFINPNNNSYLTGIAYDHIYKKLYFSDFSDNSLTIMNTETTNIIETISVGYGPIDLIIKKIE